MFTTAGSTRLTIPAKELDVGIGSGTARAVAVVPENPILFIAETRPETTDPIRIPTASVNATNTAASILRRRAQLNISFTNRKSTRLNSSHGYISYAVFCLKKKNTIPILGSLFSSRNHNYAKTELLVFLGPVVITDPSIAVDFRYFRTMIPCEAFISLPNPC